MVLLGSGLQWLHLVPPPSKESRLQVETPGDDFLHTALPTISIHQKQLITREELPETKQVVELVSVVDSEVLQHDCFWLEAGLAEAGG